MPARRPPDPKQDRGGDPLRGEAADRFRLELLRRAPLSGELVDQGPEKKRVAPGRTVAEPADLGIKRRGEAHRKELTNVGPRAREPRLG